MHNPAMTPTASRPGAPRRIVAVVQARMGSSRLPGKVLQPVVGKPLIEILLMRLARSRLIDQIVLATSDDPRNAPLAQLVEAMGYEVWRGSETDVRSRYLGVARQTDATALVRITGDCPLVDGGLVDTVIEDFIESGADYASNIQPETYPDGMDVEVFSTAALELACQQSQASADREHVTPFLRQSDCIRRSSVVHDEDLSNWRWTVDEQADLDVTRRIFERLAPKLDFPWQTVAGLNRTEPGIFEPNAQIKRNEGANMGTGQKLWKRAKQVIPGGNMLLSKRAEMFLPDLWPAYFSKAKGCSVWDLDGREYVDMSLMGIGTNTLGYGHDEVDETVMRVVRDGNMSTLNCPEEVALAEKLVALHDFADMARFARSGGEANAIAIRIARASSGRDKVAVCGYHGWHDWYLATNLSGVDKDPLSTHLLPGLDTAGVPRDLAGSVLPFRYNDFAALERLVAEHDIGVIKMEVVRNQGPADDFLQKVRQLATDNGIVLIFDECTSGFRESYGGLHLNYDVEPDLAVFGKTLGNGYAITAVIGRAEVMQAAQDTFISSTFWTERIGPAAAVTTLDVMARERSWEGITERGRAVIAGWTALADKHGLSIQTTGLPSLATYTFQSPDALAYKTLITQEMLAQGFLAGTGVYSSLAHTPEIHDRYFAALDGIFALIRECEDGRKVADLLKGPVCHSGFARLN